MRFNMKQWYIFVLFVLWMFIFEQCFANNTLSAIDKDDEFLHNQYIGMNKDIKELVEKIIKGIFPLALEAREHVNITSGCQEQMFRVMFGMRKLELWAISFPDSSGKLPDGLISGNSHMLGNFDQCLRSRAFSKDKTVEFQGRYCLIYYKPFLPSSEAIPKTKERLAKVMRVAENVSEVISFYLMKSVYLNYHDDKYGLCVPSGCSTDEIGHLVKYFGNKFHMNATVNYCHTEEDIAYFTPRKIVIICIFGLLGLLAAVGTMLDYFVSIKEMSLTDVAVRILLCFSITKNFPKVIDTKVSDKTLTCLNGIRVLTLFYIMLGHCFSVLSLYYAHTNILTLFQQINGFFPQIVQNGFLSVDVFFFISGVLNSYSRIKRKIDGKKNPGFIWLLIHRLWRIYPTYVFAILLSFLLTARGPLAQQLEVKYIENCARDWWKNLLFINNFFDQQKMCLLQSWYLSCDMQLFLISLVTVPLLMNGSKKGIIVNSAVIFIGLLFTTVWCFVKKIPPTFLFSHPELSELMAVSFSYNAPYTHAAPYFIGILLGYVLATKKDTQISKVYQLIGWPVAGLCFTSMLFITYIWNSGKEYTRIEAALYFAFSRALYVIGAAWILFCSAKGHGGIINYILSLKIWVPLSRISFMMYLTSFTLQMFYRANSRTVDDGQYMNIIWRYLGDIAVSGLLSLVMVVLVESPFIALEKIVFSSKLPKKEDFPLDNQKSMENGDALQNDVKEFSLQSRF